jgi:TnpA family transposase
MTSAIALFARTLHRPHHGQRPDILISDSGAYSDLMFGLCNALGIEYRPELADMPDQRA